jgi:hypothetical protein
MEREHFGVFRLQLSFRLLVRITYQVVHVEQELQDELVIGLEGLNAISNDVDLDGQVLRDNLPPNQIAEQTLQFFHALRVQLVLSELEIVKTILIGLCFRVGAEKFITL